MSTSSTTGIDVAATVDSLMYLARAPERQMQAQQAALDSQVTALQNLQSSLSTFTTNVDSLKDVTGVFGTMAAMSSDSTLVSATADSGAISGSHVIVVTNLSSTSSIYSASLGSATTSFGSGSLKITIGSGSEVSIDFDDAHNTLQTAADLINSKKLGITASVVTDSKGARLAIVSDESGEVGDIKIVSDTAGLSFSQGSSGKNAELTVDGVPVSSATNSISGVLAGVTLRLAGAHDGQEVKIAISPDTGRIKAAINSFVSTFNGLITGLNNQFKTTSGKAPGVLAGDSSVRDVQSQLLSVTGFIYSGGGSITSLSDIGIRMNDDGSLQMTDADLDRALSFHFDDVKNFVQGIGPDGFARTLGSALHSLSDSTEGAVALDIKGIQANSQAFNDMIDTFEVRMADRQQQLTLQYNQIDSMLKAFTSTQTQITSLLGSLPTYSNQ